MWAATWHSWTIARFSLYVLQSALVGFGITLLAARYGFRHIRTIGILGVAFLTVMGEFVVISFVRMSIVTLMVCWLARCIRTEPPIDPVTSV
jgi:hypothetical protein